MKAIPIILITALAFSSCSTWTRLKKDLGWSKDNKNSASFSKILKSTDYDYKLKMAEKYFLKKDYNHAQQLYDDLFRVMKGSVYFEDIYYKLAYCSYYLKDWLNAENLFKGFVEAFPNSPKSEEIDYMRAYTFYRQSPKVELDQTNTTKTMGFMQAFISTHPGSERIKAATEIIDKCRAKLEMKDFANAKLYYDLKATNPAYLKAASLTFNTLMNTYPDSEKSDEYKLYIIKSDYEFALLSLEDKKEARLQQVVTDCNDFMDRFPDSKLKKEALVYLNLTTNTLKTAKNEQTKKTS